MTKEIQTQVPPPSGRRGAGRTTGASARLSRSWDAVADWYIGWAGPDGSRHHRDIAIPALLQLLEPAPGELLLDVGCGAGAPYRALQQSGARYIGVDASRRLIEAARKHHRADVFHVGEASALSRLRAVPHRGIDKAFFLLSIQDIDPLDLAIEALAWALKPDGRVVIVMTHPCFRVPRQSGWGWDDGRRLRYRRIDRYLTSLDIPMQEYSGNAKGSTWTHHRSLQTYVNALSDNGFSVDRLLELPGPVPAAGAAEKRFERIARTEIPLFLGLRALRRG